MAAKKRPLVRMKRIVSKLSIWSILGLLIPLVGPHRRLLQVHDLKPSRGQIHRWKAIQNLLPLQSLLHPGRLLYIWDRNRDHYSRMAIFRWLRAAVYDGPSDVLGFEVHPVILETKPSVADSYVAIEPVLVEAGALIVDREGILTNLEERVSFMPVECRDEGCAQTYYGDEPFPGIKWPLALY